MPVPAKAEVKFDLKARMREAFAKDLPLRWAELASAVQRRDASAAARLFHGFKGSVAYIQPGGELYHLCGELEQAADRVQWEPIETQWARLEELMRSW